MKHPTFCMFSKHNIEQFCKCSAYIQVNTAICDNYLTYIMLLMVRCSGSTFSHKTVNIYCILGKNLGTT